MGMDFRELSRLVGELPFGKRVRHEHYIHAECLPFCGEELGELVETLRREAAVSSAHNVIKFNLVNPKISFLWYPEFHQQPHPELRSSVTVDLESGKVTRHDYGNSENPPILHRKETLLPAGRAEISVYEDLTRAEEARGLYRSNKTIGFKKNWERLLAEKGLGYAGHQLIVVEAPGGAREEDARVQVCRHKTAIARYRFSRPIQTVLENGLLTPDTSLLDFGCGQADDVKGLKEMGFSVSGWDPVHRPEGPKEVADVVNLGFVLNVIEDPVERTEVLNEAYELSRKLLVVSTLIATSETGKLGRPYKDGILTSRNTFQKYFRQDELEGYIEDVLHTSALAAGLGIFYVFRSPSEQQAFLARRSKRSVNWQDPKWRIRPPREPGLRVRRTDVYQRHPELLDAFWAKMLELGRVPGADEFDRYDQILREIGSARRAKNLLLQKYGEQALAEAFEFRRNDLQVYLALSNFRGRIPFRHLPAGLQQDIKVFLGGNRLALEASQALLFSAGNPEVITRLADNTPFGFLDHQALFIHRSLI